MKIELVKKLSLIATAFTACFLMSCSIEPEKDKNKIPAETDIQIETGINDATLNTSEISGKMNSLDAFAITIHPISKKYCGSCHASATAPLFAQEDRDKALQSLIDGQKINTDTPANSRLVRRLRNDSHNCWGDCEENAKEMEKAISEWVRLSDTQNEKTLVQESMSLAEASARNPCDDYDMTFLLNIEDAELTNGYSLQNTEDDVKFISSNAAANTNATAANQPTATFTFNIKQEGIYQIYANVAVPNAANQNSFFVRSNLQETYTEWVMTANNNTFGWQKLFSTTSDIVRAFHLKPGQQTIQFRHRQPNSRLSNIVITSDITFTEYRPQQKIMCFDISEMAEESGVYVGFAIEEFSSGKSYLISKPRIISPRPGLEIKGLEILINGTFLPQYSAFKAINETVSSGRHILSSATMIMAVEESVEQDRFSVRFEKISFQED